MSLAKCAGLAIVPLANEDLSLIAAFRALFSDAELKRLAG